MNWTKDMINNYLEENGGCSIGLMGEFPFSDDERHRIESAYFDTENYTESELCDYILELAYAHIG